METKVYTPPVATPWKPKDVYLTNWDGRPINLRALRDELNRACGSGVKPSLDTLQLARDIVEKLLDAGLPADDGECTNASVELVTYHKLRNLGKVTHMLPCPT